MIDTGADRTAVHPNLMTLVGSPPAGTALVRRPATGGTPRRAGVHDVRLAFGGLPTPPGRASWVEVEAIAVAPAAPGVLALIGRDMLAHCQFVYDGPAGELILVY